jgi:hypothetical protein
MDEQMVLEAVCGAPFGEARDARLRAASEARGMENPRYDIVRKENEKAVIWLEGATDLSLAESRVKELISLSPGEHQVFDLHTKQVITVLHPYIA